MTSPRIFERPRLVARYLLTPADARVRVEKSGIPLSPRGFVIASGMADEELKDLFDDVDTLYEDLYEDVGSGRKLLRTSIQEMEDRLDKLTKRDKEMEENVLDLQKQNELLQQDKAVLMRNISCLFKTAQLEIARKDKNIKELREENTRLRSVDSKPTVEAQAASCVEPRKESGKEHRHGSVRSVGALNDIRSPRVGSCRVKAGEVDTGLDLDRQNGAKEVGVRFEEERSQSVSNRNQEALPRQRKTKFENDTRDQSDLLKRDFVSRPTSLRQQHSNRDLSHRDESRKIRKLEQEGRGAFRPSAGTSRIPHLPSSRMYM